MNYFIKTTARKIVEVYMYADYYDYEEKLWEISELMYDAIMSDPSRIPADVTMANLVNAVKAAFREEIDSVVGISDNPTEIPESSYLNIEKSLIKLVESKFNWLS